MFEAEAPYRILQVSRETLTLSVPDLFPVATFTYSTGLLLADEQLAVTYTAGDVTASVAVLSVSSVLQSMADVS